MKAEKIVLGLFIVIVGMIWFMVNLGFITLLTAQQLWRYWPLALVVWGFFLIFGRGSSLPGCLIAILIALTTVGLLIAFLTPVHRYQSLSVSEMQFGMHSGEEVTRVHLDLTHHAGEFSLESMSDYPGKTLDADVLLGSRLRTTSSPESQRTYNGTIAEITIRDTADRSWQPGRQLSQWELWLTEELPSEIMLRTGATRAEIDLSKVYAEKLHIKAGAGDITVLLGSYNSDITVEGGAGSFTFHVPIDTGIRLDTSGGLLSIKGEDARVFSIGEHRYESERIDDKKAVAEIQVKAGAGSVSFINSR